MLNNALASEYIFDQIYIMLRGSRVECYEGYCASKEDAWHKSAFGPP